MEPNTIHELMPYCNMNINQQAKLEMFAYCLHFRSFSVVYLQELQVSTEAAGGRNRMGCDLVNHS